MVKSPQPFLAHIKQAIVLIEEYLGNYSYSQFEKDQKTQDAIIRQLEIIGEAASKLEEEFRNNYSEIPWREIVDFRNVLIHDYWEIDLDLVWKVATEEIRELKNALSSIKLASIKTE